MAKPVITSRVAKGQPLTFGEMDSNLLNLRDATFTIAGDSGSVQAIDLNSTVTVAGGVALTSVMSSSTVTLDLDNTAVTPGSYTKASLTIDAQGRVTAASNGSADFTQSDARTAISITDAGGEGSLSYDNATGVVTYTGPSFSGLEVTSAKNANNGYAGLDANGKVAAAQLPSYVDDVEEYANQAAFPATGETSKIYVALDNNKILRWSGSAYVEISPSPGSTDAVTEGSTNLYFTTQRARDAFSASTGITLTNGAIATTITQYADSNARSAISVTDAGGDGSLAYNSSTGVITYTGPSATDVRAHFTAGTGISITSGVIANTQTAGIADVVADTTPQLGGNLDVNGNSIVSVSSGNIILQPNGTGMTQLNNIEYHEKIHNLGTTSGTVSPDVANGNVQTITLNGNLTFNSFTNPLAGQSLSLIILTNGTSRTLTSTMKFSGGLKTLSITNTTDIISVFFDGTNYLASLGKGFE